MASVTNKINTRFKKANVHMYKNGTDNGSTDYIGYNDGELYPLDQLLERYNYNSRGYYSSGNYSFKQNNATLTYDSSTISSGLNKASCVTYEEPNCKLENTTKTFPLAGWNPSTDNLLFGLTPGTYTITRSAHQLKLTGSSTITKTFDGPAPMQLCFTLVAGGGGGGAAASKVVYSATYSYSGCGGAAGGVAAGIVRFSTIDGEIKITVGSAGSGSTNHNNWMGTSGNLSSISSSTDSVICSAGTYAYNGEYTQSAYPIAGVSKLNDVQLTNTGKYANNFLQVISCTFNSNGTDKFVSVASRGEGDSRAARSNASSGSHGGGGGGQSSPFGTGGAGGMSAYWESIFYYYDSHNGYSAASTAYGAGGGGGGNSTNLVGTQSNGGNGGDGHCWIYY